MSPNLEQRRPPRRRPPRRRRRARARPARGQMFASPRRRRTSSGAGPSARHRGLDRDGLASTKSCCIPRAASRCRPPTTASMAWRGRTAQMRSLVRPSRTSSRRRGACDPTRGPRAKSRKATGSRPPVSIRLVEASSLHCSLARPASSGHLANLSLQELAFASAQRELVALPDCALPPATFCWPL